ncbi:MAG: GreA/GreB family elongation factor [Simkaniaceae bacterium]|nr:MAG: GreA/GreB family elongation factor [Simkaniaceae bacterium]
MSMSYLGQFQKHLGNHDYPSFLSLWEEYCMGDEVDGEELKRVLSSVKSSELASPFGRHVENALPLWEKIKETDLGHEILKLIFDLQTTNTPQLGELAFNYLRTRYPEDSYFNDKIRLIGLREMVSFQGAISNYELLTHMKKRNYVFHSGGWGVGEIIDISFLREQLELEFDYVGGKKDLSFENAFKTLIPIPNDHFLALRFGNPDELEERAKKNPVETIHVLLRDLGPSTAAEIKEELCELVIPQEEWARWWQTARAKIKKDTMIETPDQLRKPFKLRESEVPHEEHLKKALEKKPNASTLLQIIYTFLRDFPQTIKNEEFRKDLEEKIKEALSTGELTDSQELQFHFFMEDLNEGSPYSPTKELITRFTSPEDVVKGIEIIAFKKRALFDIRKLREDWPIFFLNLLLTIDQNPLRDFILTELLKAKKEEEVIKKLDELLAFPSRYPQVLLWYFQKIMKDDKLPISDVKGKNRFFESLLILLSQLEHSSGNRDLIKKILTFLTTARYNNIRKVFQNASKEEVQEFLLLATKCQSLTDHDIKIFHSLAEVVHPGLAKIGKKYTAEQHEEEPVIWTTEKGYNKIKSRIHEISTVETVDNAKEIEEARALGDLRENAEFKAALERRDRLQSELKTLSAQFNQARILTKNDVDTQKVSVGVVIDFKDDNGEDISYTLLGPWEADPDKNILSFQSKLAQNLIGHKKGDKITIQGKSLTISNLRNYFETL